MDTNLIRTPVLVIYSFLLMLTNLMKTLQFFPKSNPLNGDTHLPDTIAFKSQVLWVLLVHIHLRSERGCR